MTSRGNRCWTDQYSAFETNYFYKYIEHVAHVAHAVELDLQYCYWYWVLQRPISP